MPTIVIDANVALDWLFDRNARAAAVKQVLDRSELIAPWLWRLEIANSILVYERRKLISSAVANQVLTLADELPIAFLGDGVVGTVTGLFHFARPYHLTAYDATYLELALRQNVGLYTRDRNLQMAARRAGVPLVAEARK